MVPGYFFFSENDNKTFLKAEKKINFIWTSQLKGINTPNT